MADSNQNSNSESSEKRTALIKKSDKSSLRMDRLAVLIAIGFLIILSFIPFDKLAELFPHLDVELFTIAVLFSIGAGVICYIELARKMKSVKHATRATGYLDTESVNVPIMSDKFVVYKSYKRGRIKETSEDPNKGDF